MSIFKTSIVCILLVNFSDVLIFFNICIFIFSSPKCRYIRVNHDDFFDNEQHTLSNLPTKAEKMCRYDLDVLDQTWLESYNGERAKMGEDNRLYTTILIKKM